jgi:hypothetical protein
MLKSDFAEVCCIPGEFLVRALPGGIMAAAKTTLGVLVGATALLGFAWALGADPIKPAKAGGDKAAKPDDKRVSVAVARDRAKLLHEVYSAALDTMHHHYFRREGAVLPARALDDVFAVVDRRTKVKSRWIAVNTPAMSISHEPETAFEKKAAAELSDGKDEYEVIEKGEYRRAAPIPLGVGCVSCHTRFGAQTPKTPRFAGLVITIPVKD